MTKLLIAGLAAAASAVPVIELDMAGITAYRHTEWNQPTTRLQTGQKNGDLTLSNGQVNAGQAPPTGRLPSATGQNEDQSWKLSNPQGGKAAYTAKYDATTSAPVLHQLYRDHDLSYENQKVTLTENGTGAPSVSVTSEAVKSRHGFSASRGSRTDLASSAAAKLDSQHAASASCAYWLSHCTEASRSIMPMYG